MNILADDPPSRFDGGGLYRIVVDGKIPTNWADRLSGMSVVSEDEGGSSSTSLLQGTIKDQAELNGILETLYRLQVIIISVERQNTRN